MHCRTPSGVTGSNTGSSTMRRRSGGSMAYKRFVQEDSFSQDSPGTPVEQAADVTTVSGTEEASLGYHIYASMMTSDDAGEHSLDPSFANSSGNEVLASTSPPSSDAAKSIYNDDDLIQSVGSNSSEGCQPRPSPNTTVSVDSGHKGLIRAISTTDRFTHKWPTPKSVKHFESQSKDMADIKYSIIRPSDTNAPSLEEGRGLGLSHIAQWTLFKWCLLFSVTTVFIVGSVALITSLMTWFNTWENSSVMVVADNDILILITLAGSVFVFASLIGVTGTLLNSRPILAIYALLLWPAFLSLLAVGYTSYRRASLSLDHKLNFSWSRYYTPAGKRIIQDSLGCCGFYSSMHEASPSKICYLRTPLPGCKAKLFIFERDNLRSIWTAAFSLAPIHLANMIIALLSANHITVTFGSGFTPKQYRLSPMDVKADADKILSGSGGNLPSNYFGDGERGLVASEQKY